MNVINRDAVQEAVDKLAASGIHITWEIRVVQAARWHGLQGGADEHLYVHVVRSPFAVQLIDGAVRSVLSKVAPQVHIN